MVEALQWFIGLGSTVFLPIIIIIIALFFGVKLSKAIISGITVGIGSIGLDLVIGLLSSNLGTAIQTMGEKYGNSLSIMDIWLWSWRAACIFYNIRYLYYTNFIRT